MGRWLNIEFRNLTPESAGRLTRTLGKILKEENYDLESYKRDFKQIREAASSGKPAKLHVKVGMNQDWKEFFLLLEGKVKEAVNSSQLPILMLAAILGQAIKDRRESFKIEVNVPEFDEKMRSWDDWLNNLSEKMKEAYRGRITNFNPPPPGSPDPFGDRVAKKIYDALIDFSKKHPDVEIIFNDEGVSTTYDVDVLIKNGEAKPIKEDAIETIVYSLKNIEKYKGGEGDYGKYFSERLKYCKIVWELVYGREFVEEVFKKASEKYAKNKKYYLNSDMVNSFITALSQDLKRVFVFRGISYYAKVSEKEFSSAGMVAPQASIGVSPEDLPKHGLYFNPPYLDKAVKFLEELKGVDHPKVAELRSLVKRALIIRERTKKMLRGVNEEPLDEGLETLREWAWKARRKYISV